MKVLFAVILSCIVAVAGVTQEKETPRKKTIAVLEFQSSGGLNAGETATLSNRFRGILVQTDVFDVVERERMTEILKQQDFNLSDACNSAECAVQVGQLLGVEAMIAGDLGKVGETWTIDLRLIDVGTGKIVQTHTEDYVGKIDGMLGAMRKIAGNFAGVKTHEKAPLVEKTGEIYVISTPGKAAITLDGKKTDFVTPKLFEGVPIGKHLIEVTSGTLEARKEIELTENSLVNVDLKLGLPSRQIKIVSDPLQAIVYVDKDSVGLTPIILDVTVGEHELRLKKAKYAYFTDKLVVKAGDPPRTVAASLKKMCKITLTTTPPGLKVFVNNKHVANGKYENLLAEGKYLIRVESTSKDHDDYVEEVNLTEDMTLNARPKKKTASSNP